MIQPKKYIAEISPNNDIYPKHDWRLKLDLNENIYGVFDVVYNVFKNIKKEDISLFPDCTKLLDKLSKRFQIQKENILLTNDIDDGLKIIFDTYIEKNDEVLSYNYDSSKVEEYAKTNDGILKLIEFDERFVFDIKKIIENITEKTKVICFENPDSLSGSTVKFSEIKSIASKYADKLIVIDCSYINFSYDVVFEDFVDLIQDFDNIILLKSFSFDYALAGLGIGFCVADSNIIENLKKVSNNNINSVAINCAIGVLNNENLFEEIKELNKNAKQMLSKGIEEIGYKVYPSQANFVLCDFREHTDFFYEKLKKNGVIVKKYKKKSAYSTCLRITVPKMSGVKYILELLKIKDVLIFNVEEIIFDSINSSVAAIKETFKYFTEKEINESEILQIKNKGSMDCNLNVIEFLMNKYDFDAEISGIIKVFQDFFYNPNNKNENKKYLIDNEKLLIPEEKFEEISKKYDLVIFSGRFKEEIEYLLEKFNISKYFYYYITGDDLPKNMLKPNSLGAMKILKHCPYKTIKYLGSNVDDIISGNTAGIETIGVISSNYDFNSVLNNFKHLGAKYILDDIDTITEFLCDIDDADEKCTV